MQVTVRTEKDTFTIFNVFNWFYDKAQLVVMSRSEDGKEIIRRCWRNWVYFDVVTREDEKPEEKANSQAIPKTVEYAVGDTVVTFEID